MTKKKGSSRNFGLIFCPNLGEDQKKKRSSLKFIFCPKFDPEDEGQGQKNLVQILTRQP